jgi:uncharacterized protein YraI
VNPLDIIAKGLKINPRITRILFAGVVLAACVTLVDLLVKDWQTAIIGATLFIVAVVVLLVVTATAASPHLGSTGLWFVRFVACLFAAITLALFSAWVLDWPKPIPCLINPSSCKPEVPSRPQQAVCLKQDQKLPNGSCRQVDGSFVVVNVASDDPDHGLNVRATPHVKGISLGVLPPHGTDLIVGTCKLNQEDDNIWCPVRCGNLSGWSRDRYLLSRLSTLYSIIGVSPVDPGLSIRNGPDYTCSSVDAIPPNGKNVVLHVCQSNSDTSRWCLITYNNHSGWVPAENLQRQY